MLRARSRLFRSFVFAFGINLQSAGSACRSCSQIVQKRTQDVQKLLFVFRTISETIKKRHLLLMRFISSRSIFLRLLGIPGLRNGLFRTTDSKIEAKKLPTSCCISGETDIDGPDKTGDLTLRVIYHSCTISASQKHATGLT